MSNFDLAEHYWKSLRPLRDARALDRNALKLLRMRVKR